jgi:hypothetical protein
MIIDTNVWNEDRFIAAILVGGTSNDASQRTIGYPLREKGWRNFIRDHVFPTIGLGFKRMSLHNPAGTLPNEQMQADQFIHAKEAGMTWIEDGFVDNWSKITSFIEVNCYLGMLKDDFDFKNRIERKDFAGILERLYQSYRLPLMAGMNICFDALFDVSETSPEYSFYKFMTSIGVKCIVEPTPHLNNPHLYSAHFIITEQLYQNRGADWYPPENKLTGEKIRLLNQPYKSSFYQGTTSWTNEAEWLPFWLQDCRRTNYSCMLAPWNMLTSRTTVSDLVKLSQ